MIIRPASVADIPEMIRMEQLSQSAAHWTEQQYQQLFASVGAASARLVLVAEPSETIAQGANSAGNIQGFLVARHLAPEWELENVVVAQTARRRGLGKRLLEALLARARETNSEAVFLEVRESNASARALYGSAGFLQTGRRKGYYAAPTEDAILYRRSLP